VVTYDIDMTPPASSITTSSGWRSASFNIDVADGDSLSGLATCFYSVDDLARNGTEFSGTRICNKPATVSAGPGGDCQTEGTAMCRVRAWALDNASNAGTVSMVNFGIAFSGPTTTDNAPSGWQKNDITVTLTPSGGQGGIAETLHCIDQSANCVPNANGTVVFVGCLQGSVCSPRYVRYHSRDVAGVWEVVRTSAAIRIDRQPPVTVDNAPGAWQNSDLNVSLNASDPQPGSGLLRTLSCVDINSTCNPSSNGSVVQLTCAAGSTCPVLYIRYRSEDVAGNLEAVRTSTMARIDREPPVTSDNAPAAWQAGNVIVNLNGSDGSGSGVSETRYCVDYAGLPDCVPSPLGTSVTVICAQGSACTGIHVRYSSIDQVGNRETIRQSRAIGIDRLPPVSRVVSPAPSWIRATFPVTIEDLDPHSGLIGGASACAYSIDDLGRPGTEVNETRNCGTGFTVKVGLDGDCRTEGPSNCRVEVDARDAAGNNGNPATVTYDIDYGIPVIVRSTPENGNRSVQIDSQIVLVFSEPMNEASVTGALTISPSVKATSLSWDGLTLRISTQRLQPDTEYSVMVSTGARDRSGLPLGNEFVLRFRTAAEAGPGEGPGLLAVGAGALLLIIAAAAVLWVLLRRRRRTREISEIGAEPAVDAREPVPEDTAIREESHEETGATTPSAPLIEADTQATDESDEEHVEDLSSAHGTGERAASKSDPSPRMVGLGVGLRSPGSCRLCGTLLSSSDSWCKNCGEDV
jgi:hypothetical protein